MEQFLSPTLSKHRTRTQCKIKTLAYLPGICYQVDRPRKQRRCRDDSKIASNGHATAPANLKASPVKLICNIMGMPAIQTWPLPLARTLGAQLSTYDSNFIYWHTSESTSKTTFYLLQHTRARYLPPHWLRKVSSHNLVVTHKSIARLECHHIPGRYITCPK